MEASASCISDAGVTGMTAFYFRPVSIALAIGFCFCGEPAFAETGVFENMAHAMESALPDHGHFSSPVFLSPGMVLAFGSEKYAIMGSDPCPRDRADIFSKTPYGCVNVTIGQVKGVYLTPVDGKDTFRGVVSFTKTPDQVNIVLEAISSPDGHLRTFQPPLIGVLAHDEVHASK